MPYRAVAERMQTMGCIVPDGLYTGPGPRVSSLTDEKKAILAFVTEMFEWYGTSALEELLEAELMFDTYIGMTPMVGAMNQVYVENIFEHPEN